MKFYPMDAGPKVFEWSSVKDLEDLVFELNPGLAPRGTKIEVKPRPKYTQKENHLVILQGVGPVGFTDGPLPS